MTLRIDPNTPEPPYVQLRDQIAAQIRSGELEAGAQLPPVRRLAADLGLAPNTVARAYRELESAGHVSTGRRRGTVVIGQSLLTEAVADSISRDYVNRMRQLGLDDIRIRALVTHAMEASRP